MRRLVSSLLLIISSLTACKHKSKNQGGICLSFDDRSIAQWYTLKDVFLKHNARVTFFVTQFDSLDSSEIKMLKNLQQDGHEIASHGALHVISEAYIKKNSYEAYLKNEIDASISTMKKEGFNPQSFAYPYGAKYWFTDFLLLEKFKIIRGVEPITAADVESNDNIFYTFDNDRTVSALSIDKNSGLDRPMLTKLLKNASHHREVLLLFGHAPASQQINSDYSFDVGFLEFILSEAKRNNLSFFTVGELANE